MEIQTTVGELDSVIKTLKKRPSNIYIRVIVEDAPKKQSSSPNELSKWAKISQRVKDNPSLNLNGYSKQLQKDMKMFRENFEFNHDQ